MPAEKRAEKIQLTLSPQAERYVRQDAPVEVRRMAARGALPLPPLELATVLFALLHDADTEVKTQARDSLEKLPESVYAVVLSSPTHQLAIHISTKFSPPSAMRLRMRSYVNVPSSGASGQPSTREPLVSLGERKLWPMG